LIYTLPIVVKARGGRKDGPRSNRGTAVHAALTSLGQDVVNAVVEGKTNSMAGGIYQRQGESKIIVPYSPAPGRGELNTAPGAHPASALRSEGRGSGNRFTDFHHTEEGEESMTQSRIAGLVAALTLVTMLGAPALAVADGETFKARLMGFQEVPAISTEASGEFTAKLSEDETSIEYELSYENLTGTVSQGHIHLAQRSVNGAIIVWLCQTTTPFVDPTGLAPTCPQSGTVTGTITAANVIMQAAQGIAAGEFAELVEAMRAGVTYANVHSLPQFPGGEIRGQIRKGKGDKD
jgi:hypothetical protein